MGITFMTPVNITMIILCLFLVWATSLRAHCFVEQHTPTEDKAKAFAGHGMLLCSPGRVWGPKEFVL